LLRRDEKRATPVIEVGFGEYEGFVDAQVGSPQDHEEAA